jgi:hypothetical protein
MVPPWAKTAPPAAPAAGGLQRAAPAAGDSRIHTEAPEVVQADSAELPAGGTETEV